MVLGITQVNDMAGHNPVERLNYEVKYFRELSLWSNLRPIVRQLLLITTRPLESRLNNEK